MGERVSINKGNYYDMETPERLSRFEEYRGSGWEAEYQAYRKTWSEYPREQIVAEYPLLVDLELSTICNLKCPMCYTTTEDFKSKVKRQFMDMSLFHRIIDEIGGKVPAVRLSLRGEATLHPDFTACIRYCKEKGIGEVSFLTNASNLDQTFFTEIAEAGADWITVSIDGMGEMYESIRKPLRFSDTLQKLKNIHALKMQRCWKRPVIKIQSIWPAIREDPSTFYNTFAPYTDLVAFNPLIDYLANDTEIVYEQDFRCPQVYQRLVIGADGSVLLCSNDEEERCIVGNANEQNIYAIWHGEALEKIRRLHAEGKFQTIAVCRRCYLPRATEESEKAYINGREIAIKNYINRRQEIGK